MSSVPSHKQVLAVARQAVEYINKCESDLAEARAIITTLEAFLGRYPAEPGVIFSSEATAAYLASTTESEKRRVMAAARKETIAAAAQLKEWQGRQSLLQNEVAAARLAAAALTNAAVLGRV